MRGKNLETLRSYLKIMAPRVVSVISNFYLGLLRVSKPDTFVDHKFEKYEPISKKRLQQTQNRTVSTTIAQPLP